MGLDVSCLYSIVKNTSGAAAHFPFLGENGVTLEDDGEYSSYGDIRERVAQRFGGFGRQEVSLESCLRDELLTIVSTPPPIMYDATLDQSVQLTIDNDTLAGEANCWLAVEPTTTGA